MDRAEAQARAVLAAALIVRGAVEVPSIPSGARPLPDAAGVRLRDLTDYLYRLITTDDPTDSDAGPR
ncbi:MAG TPA: hypothetical protein VFK57_13370 [Vicinamibacterales bacterium]|nr:hypothetical protein [Vicinamibacterales bacterium]